MAFTQSDLDALNDAIALGALKVKYADREVTYRSLSEMRDIRREMNAEVLGKKRSRRRVAVMTRGF